MLMKQGFATLKIIRLDKIKYYGSEPYGSKDSCISSHHLFTETIEKMLGIWIKDYIKKRAPLSGLTIRNIALHLHQAQVCVSDDVYDTNDVFRLAEEGLINFNPF